MLVLTIMLVPIINVKAEAYTSDDTVLLGSNIHDYFEAYFGNNVSYQYFPYVCGDRTCYYGINSKNEYVNITYQSTSGYSYDYMITTGTDSNFSVSGTNIFKKEIDNSRIIIFSLAFMFTFLVVWLLNRGVYSDK